MRFVYLESSFLMTTVHRRLEKGKTRNFWYSHDKVLTKRKFFANFFFRKSNYVAVFQFEIVSDVEILKLSRLSSGNNS